MEQEQGKPKFKEISKLRYEFRKETGAETNLGPKDFDRYIYWLEKKVLQQITDLSPSKA